MRQIFTIHMTKHSLFLYYKNIDGSPSPLSKDPTFTLYNKDERSRIVAITNGCRIRSKVEPLSFDTAVNKNIEEKYLSKSSVSSRWMTFMFNMIVEVL